MFWSQFRHLLLAGLVGAAFVGSAQAHFLRKCCAPTNCCGATDNCGTGCGSGCGTMTVNCIEYTQEQRTGTRTVYRQEQRQETYNTYKCENYTEQRTRNVVCNRYVTETVMVNKCVCERVPVWTEKTVMKERCVTTTETVMKTRTVDKGHYECKEVPCGPSFMDRLGGICKKHSCCNDPCGGNTCCEPCPKTKTVKCWVPCCVTECYPVTCCKKTKVCEPCTVKCCTYQTVNKTVQVPCCKTRCVQECKTETYNVCLTRKVCVPCTRTVCVCVPHCENYTYTVCVPHCVQKQVPSSGCAAPVARGCCY